ncbi:MAG: hypothetical protein AAF467_27870 [Actinomycetota bacterium]
MDAKNEFNDHNQDDDRDGHDAGRDDLADGQQRDGDYSEVVRGAAPFAGEWVMVDGVAQPTVHGGRRVLPGWLSTSSGAQQTMGLAWRRFWAATWFQAKMTPTYWWRLSTQAHKGFARGMGAWWRFTVDAEGLENLRAVRSSTTDGARGNVEILAEQHKHAIRNHLIADAITLVLMVVGALVVWAVAPWWARTLLVLAAPGVGLPVLGLVGRDRDVSIVERWISTGAVVPKLTEGLIVQALRDARIAGMDRAFKEQGDRAVRWLVPPVRLASGDGYECVLDLPSGVSVEQASKAERVIASGLSRPVSTVWISEVSEEEHGHAGRMRMVVTDTPMRSASIPPWPLADDDMGGFDIFKPIPLGVNYLGQIVAVTLMFRSMILGAIPRMGKSFTLRLFFMAASLDPTVEIHFYDLKGGIDFKDLGRKVAHAFWASQNELIAPDVLADLRRMVADMGRRYDTLNRLAETDPDRIPEGKITRELANDRSLGLHPVLLGIDETQTCFMDWADHKEFTALVTKLAKMGPAVGIMVILATQSVNNSTIPRSISVTAGLRFCLKVTDHSENDQILGTGAYSRGHRASELSTDDMGLGYFGGEGADTQLVKCFFVDGPGATAIAERARQLRAATGRLTGAAAGDEPEAEPGFADRLAAVWPDGRGRMPYADLADRLAAQWPDLYHGWTVEQVSSAGKAIGLEAVQVKHQGRNLWGFRHTDVLAAATQRDQPTHPEPPQPDADDDGWESGG